MAEHAGRGALGIDLGADAIAEARRKHAGVPGLDFHQLNVFESPGELKEVGGGGGPNLYIILKMTQLWTP